MRKVKMKVFNLGNNETAGVGVFEQQDGTFLATTFTQSKYFKTEKGAVNWLKKRGFDMDEEE